MTTTSLPLISFQRALLFAVLLIPVTLSAQDKPYGSVVLEVLPRTLSKDRSATLIDVRSAGEFQDTSMYHAYNMGRLKGAVHVDGRELPQRMGELRQRCRGPIYVYSSHAERSRKACSIIADSLPNPVVHVDGGLVRFWNGSVRLNDLKAMVVTDLPYELIGGPDLCQLVDDKGVLFVDVRPGVIFERGGTELIRAGGAPVNRIHIPVEALTMRMGELPKDGKLVLYDQDGGLAAAAALLLTGSGHTDVSVLFEGLDGLLQQPHERFPCQGKDWSSTTPYRLVAAEDLDTAEVRMGPVMIIDIRSNEAYLGTSPETWRNIGTLRGSFHMPADRLKQDLPALELFVHDPIMVMDHGHDGNAFEAARTLVDMGHTDVRILTGGLSGLQWHVRNTPGMAHWERWMLPAPGEE
ncbi:MAG: rhodanese-like domain-containing protein [Flavobacteriales bacterium]|nr:rhodanese-like domain-containing protein [Flavobacteriales bacterium]